MIIEFYYLQIKKCGASICDIETKEKEKHNAENRTGCIVGIAIGSM